MKPEDIQIRPATPADAEFLAHSIIAALRGDGIYAENLKPEIQDMLQTAIVVCRQDDTLYSWRNALVAEADGKAVGSLTAYEGTNYRQMRDLTFSYFEDFLDFDPDVMQDETCAGEYYLDSLAVVPAYRKKGIGTLLMKAGIQYARDHQIPHLTLIVDPNRTQAKHIYRELGFRAAGELFCFGRYFHRMIQDTADPMRIDILTVLPEMLDGFLNCSIVARARKKRLVDIHVHNLRDYTLNRQKRVDDYPYGGSAGMVMQCEPIDRCISALTAERHYDEIIFTSPDGEQFSQPVANELSLKKNLIILCGHFKGIDWRIREHLITREISIGDYVLTGGELAAAVMTDAIVRIIPGVIGDEQSALSDSFQDNLLAPPVYTRPADYKGWKVPDVLLSGNDRNIRNWELEQALERTRRLRPDLLE